MAKLNAIVCLTGEVIIVSGAVTPDEIWLVEDPDTGDQKCVLITSGTTTGATNYSAITEYNSCEECYDAIDTGLLMSFCDGIDRITVSTSQITNEFVIENYYRVEYENEIRCAYVDGLAEGIDASGVTFLELYENCDACSVQLPRSANTESNVCVIICNTTGGTEAILVEPPHPVWTDGNGAAVTQLNAITLGGMYGLNA